VRLRNVERQMPFTRDVAVEQIDAAKDDPRSVLALLDRRQRESLPNEPDPVDQRGNLDRRSQRRSNERIEHVVGSSLDRIDGGPDFGDWQNPAVLAALAPTARRVKVGAGQTVSTELRMLRATR